jgi:hypothetical protein
MRDGGRSLKEEALERDYPKLRRSTVCAYCTGPKEVGLVVCWRCNREEKQFTAKTGQDCDWSPEFYAVLDRAEI